MNGSRKREARREGRNPRSFRGLQVWQTRKGFTIVELLVAISLFVIAVSVAVGGFVRALRTQRQLISLISANSNASLAIEQMAREMRTGSGFQCVNGTLDCTILSFTNANGEKVTYSEDELSQTLARTVGNGPPNPLTAANVRIVGLGFHIFQSAGNFPPRLTVTLGVGVKDAELQGNITNIQTTVSSRSF